MWWKGGGVMTRSPTRSCTGRREAQQFRIEPMPEIEHGLLDEALVQFANPRRHQAEQALGHGLVGEDQLAERAGGHDAGLAPGQGAHIGRTLDPVHGREFAKQLIRPQFVEDDLLAGGGAHEDAHIAGQQEIDVRRELVEIDQGLLGIEPPPVAAGFEGSQIDVQILEQQRVREPGHVVPRKSRKLGHG